MKNTLKIKTLHAFISEDKDGNEGVIGQLMPDNTWVAFVAADQARINSLYPLAQRMAAKTDMKIKLVKFSMREDIETITPPTIQ